MDFYQQLHFGILLSELLAEDVPCNSMLLECVSVVPNLLE